MIWREVISGVTLMVAALAVIVNKSGVTSASNTFIVTSIFNFTLKKHFLLT